MLHAVVIFPSLSVKPGYSNYQILQSNFCGSSIKVDSTLVVVMLLLLCSSQLYDAS